MNQEQENITRFNSIANQWDADIKHVHMAQKVGRAIGNALQFTGSERVLEIGAGTGLATMILASKVAHLTALDASKGMLDVLRSKAESKGLSNVTIVEGSVLTQLPAGPFDAIYSALTMHHVEDVAALLKTLFQHLTPGGRLALADLDTEDGTFHKKGTAGVAHLGFDRKVFGDWLTAAGFAAPTFTTAYTVKRQDDDGTQHSYPIFLALARKPA